MRAVVQRVQRAKVTVDDELVGQIGQGMVVLLGVGVGDDANDVACLAEKVYQLRIFDDQQGKMNRSLSELEQGAMLVVSQFTLYGDCRKGRRPSYSDAASPAVAEQLYEQFVRRAKELGATVATGRFRAAMQLELVNDGPVTLLLDSRRL
jgi:D-tyrosyl-tRNA(Tyr) deacylase